MVNSPLIFGTITAATANNGPLSRGARLTFHTLIDSLLMAIGVFFALATLFASSSNPSWPSNASEPLLIIALIGGLPLILGFLLLDKKAR